MSVRGKRWVAVAAAVAAFGASTGVATPASAVSPPVIVTVVAVARDLIGIYQELAGNKDTVDRSTKRILAAVEAAKREILQRIDGIAAADVRSCARSAVIDLADFETMTTDTRQAFARDATSCVTKAEALVGVVGAPAVDAIGIAMNIVGPVALFARTASGLQAGRPELQQVLINTNKAVMRGLNPSCVGSPLWGDVPVFDPRPQQQYWVEVLVTCTAYDGHQGTGSAQLRLVYRKPAPPDHPMYADARSKAAEQTSYVVAEAANKFLSQVPA